MEQINQTMMQEPQKPSRVGFYILLFGVIILLAGLGAMVLLLLQSQNKISGMENSLANLNTSQSNWEEEKNGLLEQIDELNNQEPEFEGYGVIEKYESPLGFSFVYPLYFYDDNIAKKVVVEENIEDSISSIKLVLEKEESRSIAEINIFKKNTDQSFVEYLNSLQDDERCVATLTEGIDGKRYNITVTDPYLEENLRSLEVCKYISDSFNILKESEVFLTQQLLGHDAPELWRNSPLGYSIFVSSLVEVKNYE